MRTIDVSKGDKIRLFSTLAIETGSLCNRTCVFCPVTKDVRADEYMAMGLIEKMIQELKALRWRGSVINYIYNEPMMDDRYLAIIRYIRRNLPTSCVGMSTNGDFIKNKEQLEELFVSGVTQLVINVYAQSDDSSDEGRRLRGHKHAELRYNRFNDWVAELDLDTKSSVYLYTKPSSRICRVEKKWGITASSKLATYELQNRSGNIPWFKAALKEPLEKSCVRPFRILNINWRGDAILCCNDYHGETNFGNIATSSLVDIWNHPNLHRYRVNLQEKDRRLLPLCDVCDYKGGIYPHMVERVTGVLSNSVIG
jgi:MoaA/NifB/PqqE/SkfB family radical SAM enzyme